MIGIANDLEKFVGSYSSAAVSLMYPIAAKCRIVRAAIRSASVNTLHPYNDIPRREASTFTFSDSLATVFGEASFASMALKRPVSTPSVMAAWAAGYLGQLMSSDNSRKNLPAPNCA